MRPTWGQSGSCWPQVGPMLAPWTLLSGTFSSNQKPQMPYSSPTKRRVSVEIYILLSWLLCCITSGYIGPCHNETCLSIIPQIAKFMGPTWGPPGSCRPQMGPILAPWNLLLGSATVTTMPEIWYLTFSRFMQFIHYVFELLHWHQGVILWWTLSQWSISDGYG